MNSDVIRKLKEESRLRIAQAQDADKAADEIGDAILSLLFSVRDICGGWGVPPETALALIRNVVNADETDAAFGVKETDIALARMRRVIELN